jgi:hypothetical protein
MKSIIHLEDNNNVLVHGGDDENEDNEIDINEDLDNVNIK